MLSIDIGIHNLGYTYIEIMEKEIVNVEFGLYNIDENRISSNKNYKNKDIVVSRCNEVGLFFNECLERLGEIRWIVIERQVQKNIVAMELMYCLTTLALTITNNVFIFDPAMKFTSIGMLYNTKNKEHKKLSIKNAKKWLNIKFKTKLKEFLTFKKQDDIADSLNQGLIYLFKNKLINTKITDYKKIIYND